MREIEKPRVGTVIQPSVEQVKTWYKELVGAYQSAFKSSDQVAMGKAMALSDVLWTLGLSALSREASSQAFAENSNLEAAIRQAPSFSESQIESMYMRLVLENAIVSGYTPLGGRIPENEQEDKEMRLRSRGFVSQMNEILYSLGQSRIVGKAISEGDEYRFRGIMRRKPSEKK